MIKARGTRDDGSPIMIIGLSQGNIDRLREGKPIAFDGTSLGYPGDVLIMYGATEEAIVKELRAVANLKNTKVHREKL